MLYACVREEAPSYIIVVGLEIITAVIVKSTVCWVVISCNLERAQRFGRTQSPPYSRSKNKPNKKAE
jgi:hypothetical protein